MATVNLGRIKPVFKGAYNNSTAYVVDDIVTSGGSSYICIQASTGNAVSNATYWTQMSSAGTNGTDVGTTITTQGDILYRDGSGLARLGAGVSGQVLQTGGAGANPSWGTVSSDFVKIITATGGGTNAFDITNIFSADYENYFIVANFHTSGTSNVAIKLLDSSNSPITGNYVYVGEQANVGSGGSGVSVKSGWNDSYWYPHEAQENGTASFGAYLVWVHKPFVSTTQTNFHIECNLYDGGTMRNVYSKCRQTNVESMKGIRFFMTGSHNITNLSKATVYGFKQ